MYKLLEMEMVATKHRNARTRAHTRTRALPYTPKKERKKKKMYAHAHPVVSPDNNVMVDCWPLRRLMHEIMKRKRRRTSL